MKYLENYNIFEPWKKENSAYVYKCIYFCYENFGYYGLTLPGENDEILDYETGNKVNWNHDCEEETLLLYSVHFKRFARILKLGDEIEEVVEFVENYYIQKEANKYNI